MQHTPGFPSSPLERRSQRRRQRLRRAGTVIVGGALVAGGVVVVRSSGSTPESYRTAVVTARPIESTLDAVATIEPTSQASVSFPVAGTIATLSVSPK